MEREIARLLPSILLGMFILGVLLFLLALHQLRVRRTGAYWRLRRRAGDRGGRLFLLSVGLMAASVVLALLSGLAALAYRNVIPTATRGPGDLYGIILSPTPEGLTAPETPEPTAAPTAEPSGTPTAMREPAAALSPSVVPPTSRPTNTAAPPPTNTAAPTNTVAFTRTSPPPTLNQRDTRRYP
jgi:hypothetical protein